MTVYIDDITISSNNKIKAQTVKKVKDIIKSSGYSLSTNKLKNYTDKDFKKITGNIISRDGSKLLLPNKIRYKIKHELVRNKLNKNNKKQILGYVNYMQQIKKSVYNKLQRDAKKV